MRWFFVHSTNWKGPVPTGFSGLKSLGTIFRSPTVVRKAALAFFSSNLTVVGFTTVIDATWSDTLFEFTVAAVAGSATRSKLRLTSSAVTGVPSWNFAPWRRVKIQV